MKIIGLTGSIGSGKSTVAQLLKNWGIPVADADVLARHAIDPLQGRAFPALIKHFGKNILDAKGTLDRIALGRLVFSSPHKLKELNRIVHPEVSRLMKHEIKQQREAGSPLMVLDIPLLYETDFWKLCHEVVLVYTPEKLMLERLKKRDGISEAEIRQRIASQISIEDKKQRADHVIDNSGSPEATEKKVKALFEQLTALK